MAINKAAALQEPPHFIFIKHHNKLIDQMAAFALITLLIIPVISATETSGSAAVDFIRSKCDSTDYPTLCVASLSSYAPTIHNNPWTLVDAALNVSLGSVRSASAMMSRLRDGVIGGPHGASLSSRDAAALRDCVETLGDSVTYLQRSLKEMGVLTSSGGARGRGRLVVEKMEDVRTWVSTALTDESTCMDGFGGDGPASTAATGVKAPTTMRREVRGRVLRVARLTSNALALIAQLASTINEQSP